MMQGFMLPLRDTLNENKIKKTMIEEIILIVNVSS